MMFSLRLVKCREGPGVFIDLEKSYDRVQERNYDIV